MSPKQGRRKSPPGKGGKSGAGRLPTGPAEVRRFGLLVFGVAFAALFLGVGIAVGVGHPSVPSGDVAIVEGAPGDAHEVTKAEFEHALEQAAAQAGLEKTPKPGEERYDELRKTALNNVLDIAWLEAQANEMGMSVSDKEVATRLRKLKKESFKSEAEYRKFLKEAHYTAQDVNERVKLEILSQEIQEQLTNSAPKPSHGEVANYYEAAKSTQFTQKPSRDVRVVVNKDPKKIAKAKALLEKDDSAQSWEKVAKKFSEDPVTKENGGLQQGLTEGAAEEPLGATIFEAPEEKLVGPVKGSRGYFLFEVESSNPENVQPLEQVESQIEAQLTQRNQQDAFSIFLADDMAKGSSRTFCASGEETERCAGCEAGAHPATAPPGCYEAEPKGGMPEACPAPVAQAIPALPGSVTPVEPQGKPLAQRPRPAGLESGEGAGATGMPFPTPTP